MPQDFQATQPSGDPAFADTAQVGNDADYPEPPFVVGISPPTTCRGEPADWRRAATAVAAGFALIVLAASIVH